jgi:DNA-directed RNA polymerase subunit RPC12/RpoP
MAICNSCGREIAEGAVVCKHCGARLGVPKRPKGVTAIAVLCFIGAGMSLLALPALNPMNSILLGFRVPVNLMRSIGVIGIGLSIYCGVGFLKLKASARKIYLWWALYSIVQSVISPIVLWPYIKDMGASNEVIIGALVGMVVGTIIGLALYGYILYYIFRRRDYFVN